MRHRSRSWQHTRRPVRTAMAQAKSAALRLLLHCCPLPKLSRKPTVPFASLAPNVRAPAQSRSIGKFLVNIQQVLTQARGYAFAAKEAGQHGGPAGDLYVVLQVAESKHFERQGQDLIYTAEISLCRPLAPVSPYQG